MCEEEDALCMVIDDVGCGEKYVKGSELCMGEYSAEDVED